MRKTQEKLKKKLRSRAGESLAETLVALLIAAVALVMLAGAVTTATGVITKSQNKLDAYYGAAESMTNRTSGTSLTDGITITDGTSKNVTITYYSNSEFTATQVVTYVYSASATGGN